MTMRWMRFPLLAGLLVLATLAYGGSEQYDAEARSALMVAPGATSVQLKKLGPFHQIYYVVTTPYPAEEVLDWLREQLERRGWKPLKEDFLNPGLASSHVRGWDSFLDASRGPVRRVYQWAAWWQDANGGMVVYLLRYETTKSGTPDMNTLHVVGSYSSKAVAEAQRRAANADRARGD